MKLLAVLLAILAGVWLWRRGQRPPQQPNHRQPPVATHPKALPMLRCARCGTHLPATEVVTGRHGSYCCSAHRQEAEGA